MHFEHKGNIFNDGLQTTVLALAMALKMNNGTLDIIFFKRRVLTWER